MGKPLSANPAFLWTAGRPIVGTAAATTLARMNRGTQNEVLPAEALGGLQPR
jgi:hypothetical protein